VRFFAAVRVCKPVQQWATAFFVAVSLVWGVFSGDPVWGRDVLPLQQITAVQQNLLPPEAVTTLGLIHRGGPFLYAKDGVVFGNREKILPYQTRGYYREYTVPTPGARHRGAHRIVCGGFIKTQPEACFYTADHYASFNRIVQ
jgi:ribonuclease T1